MNILEQTIKEIEESKEEIEEGEYLKEQLKKLSK